LPPGRVNSHVATRGNCWGAYAQILPQMEQQAVFNAFNFNVYPDTDYTSTIAAANSTGAVSFISALICPSDSSPRLVQVGNAMYATHNYLLNVGSGYAVVPTPSPTYAGWTSPNGVLFENTAVPLASIIDGTSA